MPLSLSDIITNPCPTCDVTLAKILKYQGRSLADLAMEPEVFMKKHITLCLRNLRNAIFSDAEDSDDQDTTTGDSDQNAGRDLEEHGLANGGRVYSVDGQEGCGVGDVSSGNGEPTEGRIDVSLREEKTQSPEAKREAELRKRLQSLTYLTLPVGKTFEKEEEIRQEVIKSGRLPEGRTVGDLLNIPITPFSEFQEALDATKTGEEKLLVEEMIVKSLHDMQMEYFMIDEAVRSIEAEIDTSESETRGSGERKGVTEVFSIHNPLEPEDSVVWEDKKEADLYGFPYDPSAMRRGNQNPTEQTGGKYSMRGRELRSRSKPIELPLYPGYEHHQRNQALQTKLTRRRKEKEKGVETSTETLRADSVPPPSAVVPRKRPGRPPKNPAPVLPTVPKDQTLPALLSRTGSANGYSVSPPPAEQYIDPQNGAGGPENMAPTKCLHVRFSLARRGELGGILSRQPNPLRVSGDSVGESSAPSMTQSMPVAPSQFYQSERQTGQGDSFLDSPNGGRSESPHGESAPESIVHQLEIPTKSGDGSRVRSRVRVRNRAPRRAADRQPATGSSALRIETSGTSISTDQPEPSKTTPGNSVGYSTEADSVASDGGQNFHSSAFQSPKKTPGASPRRASGNPPAVMQFSSTPSPMYGVFSSRSPFPPGTSDMDPYRPRVRGKTYKTPTSITRTEAPPKTTTEEEFLAAQNGNLGKRKRVKTALAYEAPSLRRKEKADAEDDGEEDIFSESSEEEPDEDDSGGYGKRRRKRR